MQEKNTKFGLKHLFSIKDSNSPSLPTESTYGNIKKTGETYKQWGTRWAGQTNATLEALTPALQVVICQQKKEQAENTELQELEKNKLRSQIEQLENDIKQKQNDKKIEQDKVDNLQEKINDKNREISELKTQNGGNHLAKINFYIGITITLFLAIYLFVFYSSASYSAFFRSSSSITADDIGNAIFYPHAITDAFNTSFLELMLIILMPIVFLGLGYLVHQYTQKKGIEKYFKTFAIYAVTFIFDGLLAYEISKKIYEIEILTKLGEFPEYSVGMAFMSPEFWIIIFAGFIAYIIWGLVFDFTMGAYADSISNKSHIEELKKVIDRKEAKLDTIKTKIQTIDQEITRLSNNISDLNSRINNTVSINWDAIKQELNNFYQGWLGYMTLVNKPNEEILRSRETFDDLCKELTK